MPDAKHCVYIKSVQINGNFKNYLIIHDTKCKYTPTAIHMNDTSAICKHFACKIQLWGRCIIFKPFGMVCPFSSRPTTTAIL